MKILFIVPAIGKKENQKYIGTWKMEPLTVATLKALTPNNIETFFFDDRIESINYDIDVDLVSISVEVYTAKRAYKIADKFRANGKTVILGGYHVNAVPEEAAEHADAICLNNAESYWENLLDDYKKGTLKKIYVGDNKFSDKLPDRSIFKGKKYLPITLIETGQGGGQRSDPCRACGQLRRLSRK